MNFSIIFVVICMIYQASAGGTSFFSSITPSVAATVAPTMAPTTAAPTMAPTTVAPTTLIPCPSCLEFWRDGIALVGFSNCDPAGKDVCAASAITGSSQSINGYCAGLSTEQFVTADLTPFFISAQVNCPSDV